MNNIRITYVLLLQMRCKSRDNFAIMQVFGGIFAFFDSMISSVRALMWSAEFFDVEEESGKESKFDKWLEAKFGDKVKDIVIYFSLAVRIQVRYLIVSFNRILDSSYPPNSFKMEVAFSNCSPL
mgnify:CR=1 FL=1